MSRFRALLLVALVLSSLPVVAAAKPADPESNVKAGVGVVDATWNVGASAGQYATERYGIADTEPRPEDLVEGDHDPNQHQVKRTPSYGVESRLTVRAIVVEGNNGKRVALMKSDNYLAQDMLTRRAAQILAERGSSITKDRILHAATHNHSSPYYTTPAWGVWAFQDAADLRMFEYQARVMADAITKAENSMKPVRMGATEVKLEGTFRNVPGPKVADDGSPTGYPKKYNDDGLVVVRFDDVSDDKKGKKAKPLAVWMNYGVHPESLEDHDLITADWVGPMERMVDRATGVPTVFSQGGVGSSEPNNEEGTIIDHGVRSAFYHYGFAQAERHARLMADKVIEAFNLIGEGNAKVPYSTDFAVDMFDGWVPGPVSQPYPSVSNCRTEPTIEGKPGAPVAGVPDCERGPQSTKNGDGALPIMENLKMHGLPVPENYGAPSFSAVQENLRIHLQVVKLGDVVLASCSCEAQVDLILNLESRLNDIDGDIYDGYDWSEYCEPDGDGWKCANPETHDFKDRSLKISDAVYQRMVAQVHNDAAGWDAPEYAPYANAEPADPKQIKGNFTKEELKDGKGYKLAVGIGHAGDYNGYVVSYREYMSFDEYRKALTAWGPHTADYMNTRLVRMAGYLNGGPHPGPEFLDVVAQADEARQEAASIALGQAAKAAYEGWGATLPDDVGPAGPLAEPENVTRFDAATFTWRGGNNSVDQPVVRVERLREGNGRGRGREAGWESFADQTGEVQTVVEMPKGVASVATYRANQQEWKWTANFEAADYFPRHVTPEGQVPDGTYRFVVDGVIREGGENKPYHLESKPFTVSPWTGLKVKDVRLEPGGAVSFEPLVEYPLTYDAHDGIRFIRDDGGRPICRTCTFRPWASSGTVVSAVVTVVRSDGSQQQVAATQQNGRWVAPTALAPGDRAYVAAGAVRDEFGETNGTQSNEVRG